jgi:hypothetical protein
MSIHCTNEGERYVRLWRLIIAVTVILTMAAGCGKATPAATPVPPAEPVAPPTATAVPPTDAPEPTQAPPESPAPTGAPVSFVDFVDSEQRLGEERSRNVSLGDLDGDGDLDALVGNEGQAQVWLNDGGGTFSGSSQSLEIPSGWNMDVVLGDLDGDGDLDGLVVVFEGPGRVLLNDGGAQGGTPGAFTDSGQHLRTERSFRAALGDLDGDGDLDAYVAREHANSVLMNDGQGLFTDSGQALGEAITADVGLGDLDGDGDLDALAGGWDEPAKVWLNDGTGTFSKHDHDLTSASVHVHGLALGDVDGDGDMDVSFAVASGHPNQVWLNDGTGAFADSGQKLHSALAHGIAMGDLDGDGDLDAVLANGASSGAPNAVWLNDGRGSFSGDLSLGREYSADVALGDLDGDGDLDVLAANTYHPNQIGKPNTVWLNGTVSASASSPTQASPPSSDDAAVEGWAVLAEKDDYSDVDMTPLPIDYANLSKLRQALLDLGWQEDHIQEVREFDRESLRQALGWLAENTDEDDAVFVYVAAHGMYLRRVVEWSDFFAADWAAVPSQRRVLVIDACQAALMTGVVEDDDRPHLSIAAVDVDEYGWCGLEEEGLPIIGGVFTHFFAAAFAEDEADGDGDGAVSAQEAALWAEAQQRTYMHDVVFAVPEFLEMYQQGGSHPENDPEFPDVVVDDAIGEPLYLTLE